MKAFIQPSLRARESGMGIVVALIVIAVLLPLVAISYNYTTTQSIRARSDRDLLVLDEACDAASEIAWAKWKDWIKSNGGRLPTVADCTSTGSVGVKPALAQPILSGSKKFRGATVDTLTISPVDAADQKIDGALTASAQKTAMRTLIPLALYPHRIGRAYMYRCTAKVTMTTRAGAVSHTINRYFRKTDASLWQAMMFFDGDLDLFPSPEMPLNGWIHTNSNGYLAHANNTNNLTINGDFTFSGNPATLNKGTNSTIQDAKGLVYGVTYLQELDEPAWSSWKAPVWSNGYSSQVSQIEQLDPLSQPRSEVIDTTDSNTNNDSLREIIERPTDTNSDGKRTKDDDVVGFAERRFYTFADFKIIVNRTLPVVADRIKILDSGDNRITDTFATNVIAQALGKSATTGLPTTKDLYDYREAGNVTSNSAASADVTAGHVTATDIDMSKLTPLLNADSRFANGVIYFKDETPLNSSGVSNKRAMRLQKGGTLPDIGLTIVTEDGAYVQGDYNTGTTYNATTGAIITQPQANASGGDPNNNVVGTYVPKPAAVCADAVSFLSNAWSDTYSATTATTARVGSATTFNTAFMSGYVPTNTAFPSGANVRDGGGINFPRVLEDWAGNSLTYWGSMVQMYNSQVLNTPWVQYIYGAAKRPWNFQTRFLNDPPPGPLEITEYSRGRFIRM